MGHDGPFRPQPDFKGLWVQLRLATMSAIHSCASQRRTGRPTSAHTAAAYIVHHLRTDHYQGLKEGFGGGQRSARGSVHRGLLHVVAAGPASSAPAQPVYQPLGVVRAVGCVLFRPIGEDTA